MKGEFVLAEQNGWQPKNNGIEWLGRWATSLAKYEVEVPSPVYFKCEDGLFIQCTMDNTRIYINDAEPDMDVVAVFDPRDGLWFNFFRGRMDSDEFDNLKERLIMWAMIIDTPIPTLEVQGHFFSSMDKDVEDALFVPDEWLEGGVDGE